MKRQFKKTAAAPAAKGSPGRLALHKAAVDRDYDRVRKLLKDGYVSINETDYPRKETPLHVLAGDGETALVGALIARGADVDARDMSLMQPLHHAALSGHADIAAELFSAGADVNARTERGWTPLHVAAIHGHMYMVTFLAKHCGADPGIRDRCEETAADLARNNGSDPIARWLDAWALHLQSDAEQKAAAVMKTMQPDPARPKFKP